MGHEPTAEPANSTQASQRLGPRRGVGVGSRMPKEMAWRAHLHLHGKGERRGRRGGGSVSAVAAVHVHAHVPGVLGYCLLRLLSFAAKSEIAEKEN